MLKLLEYILRCLVRHYFYFLLFFPLLYRFNKDVLFNLRVSSLTESGLYKDASDFNKL